MATVAAAESIEAPAGRAALAGDTVLSVRSVAKRFPGIQALDDVTFSLRAGEVHGLVGGNGAGKSTLIKIMTGAEWPDSGTVEIEGGRAGIAAIYQELTVIPEMTAVANVFLGAPLRRGPFLARRRMVERFTELSARLDARIDPLAKAGRLSVADQQLLEIMRALVNRHRIIIMDEPTASLGATERRNLYRIVGEISRQGTAILYIGHDLDEVIALTDRISVMRDGRLVDSRDTPAWTKKSLVQAMLDAAPSTHQRVERRIVPYEVLRVEQLALPGRKALDFGVNRGEILGIAGLVGSGRTSILHALAGLRPQAKGKLVIDGLAHRVPRSVREAMRLGIVLTPEDRKTQGLVLSLDGGQNLSLTNLSKVSVGGFVRADRKRSLTHAAARSMGFKPERLGAPARTLSGGNQQKLAIGKWLPRAPAVLLLDEPTRGIDIGAKAEIYRTIRTLCEDGMSVIVVSSEFPELVEHCDRILVVAQGAAVGTIGGAGASTQRLMTMIFAGAEAGEHQPETTP